MLAINVFTNQKLNNYFTISAYLVLTWIKTAISNEIQNRVFKNSSSVYESKKIQMNIQIPRSHKRYSVPLPTATDVSGFSGGMEIFTGLVRFGLSGNLKRSERVAFTDGGFVQLEDFEAGNRIFVTSS